MSIVEYNIQNLLKKSYKDNRTLINAINIGIKEMQENKQENVWSFLGNIVNELKAHVFLFNNIVICVNEEEKFIDLKELENIIIEFESSI